MKPWLLDVIGCPGCGGRLAMRAPGLLRCRVCQAPYPVVADTPIVVPAPTEYLAAYRDAVLAALAERGRASRVSVDLVERFAAAGPRLEPHAFGDDWVAGEADGGVDWAAVARPPGDGPAVEAFAGFLVAAGAPRIDDVLVELAGDDPGTVVEVGSGVGLLARRLARRAERLLVTDLSLRAVLRAPGGARAAGAVLDADALALRPRSTDLIVASQLIDLLPSPPRFLTAAGLALRRHGRLLLATPDPGLGTGDDRALRRLMGRRWQIVAERRGVPWIRAHGRRHFEVYFADVIAATPRR